MDYNIVQLKDISLSLERFIIEDLISVQEHTLMATFCPFFA